MEYISGMPTVNAMFDLANKRASNPFVCFINADILLGIDFVSALQNIPLELFIMIGQRWDTDWLGDIEAPDPEEVALARKNATQTGGLRGKGGAMDYFACPKGTTLSLPSLVPGGTIWDNYMVYYCRQNRIPVVDATSQVLAVHQNHEYARVAEGKKIISHGPAAQHNYNVAYEQDPMSVRFPLGCKNAHYLLTNSTLKLSWTKLSHLIPRLKARCLYILGHWMPKVMKPKKLS